MSLNKQKKKSLRILFIVTQKKGNKTSYSYPIVSCDPLVVNFHLNPGALTNGLVLNGIVESVEDKGIISKKLSYL